MPDLIDLKYNPETGTFHDPASGKEIDLDDANAPNAGRPLDEPPAEKPAGTPTVAPAPVASGNAPAAQSPAPAPGPSAAELAASMPNPTAHATGATGVAAVDSSVKSPETSSEIKEGFSPEARKAADALKAAAEKKAQADKDAIKAQRELESAHADAEAASRMASTDELRVIRSDVAGEKQEHKDKQDALEESIIERQEQPKSYWGSKSDGQKASLIIGTFLSGLAGNGQENAVFGAILKDIDNFHKQQADILTSRENLMKVHQQGISDLTSYLTTSVASQKEQANQDLEAVKAKVNAEAAKIGSPQAIAKANQASTTIDAQQAKNNLEIERLQKVNITQKSGSAEAKIHGVAASGSPSAGLSRTLPQVAPTPSGASFPAPGATLGVPQLPPNATSAQKQAFLDAVKNHPNNKGQKTKATPTVQSSEDYDDTNSPGVLKVGGRRFNSFTPNFVGVNDPGLTQGIERFQQNERTLYGGVVAITAMRKAIERRDSLPVGSADRERLDAYIKGTLAPQAEAALLSIGSSNSYSAERVAPLMKLLGGSENSAYSDVIHHFFSDPAGIKTAGLKGLEDGLKSNLVDQSPNKNVKRDGAPKGDKYGKYHGKSLREFVDSIADEDSNVAVSRIPGMSGASKEDKIAKLQEIVAHPEKYNPAGVEAAKAYLKKTSKK